MHGDSSETCARTHHRRWRVAALINTLLVVVVTVAACSNGNGATDENRQFATDRHTETPGVATEIPSEIPAEIPTMVATPQASPMSGEALPTSPVKTLYAIAEGGVIAIDVATGATRVICRSDKTGDVIRIASSPDGDHVAVLRKVKKGDKARYDLEIRSATGDRKSVV